MIVLHAAIVEGEFFLWGERPVENRGVGKPIRKGRMKTRPGIASPSPYDAGIEEVAAALKEAGLRFALQSTKQPNKFTFNRVAELGAAALLGRRDVVQ